MHLKLFAIFVNIAILTSSVFSQDYKEVWDHINKNERKEALSLLEPKIQNKTASADEFITYYYLKIFEGREADILDFSNRISISDNPNAYTYALWFGGPVAGTYGLKEPHQLELLNQVINAKPGNGTLRASAHYNLGHHYVRTHQFNLIESENNKIGALSEWQFVGPFNNISGSGFNKNYQPINDPSDSSYFLSSSDAPIRWFTPIEKSTEGWISTSYSISDNSQGIIFAQTFVNSLIDQDIYLCSGFAGNIKIWVNDQLIIKVPEERLTEIDAYTSKCHLNAGYNRILLQTGSDKTEPSFIIRLTDTNYNPISNIKSSATPQDYQRKTGESLEGLIPLFAETYFQGKIAKEPDNLINYILLNEVYLRSNKTFEARTILEKAITLAPNNSILKYELALCYLKDDNRTGLAEVYEYFLAKEKESLISYLFRIKELVSQKKYQEALDLIEQRINIYGKDETTYGDKINALANLNQVPKLVALINEAYQKYPDNSLFVNYVFNVEKKINKNPKRAVKILEDYLEHHYDYSITKLLIQEYYNLQNVTKPFKLIEEQIETWPFTPSLRLDLENEYLVQQRYKEAFDVANFMLKMKPYSGYYFENKASVEELLNNNDAAIENYHMAFKYQPTLYESREKLRRLEKKKNLFDSVTDYKIDDLISSTGKNIKTEDYDYYFLQSETDIVLYAEGGREEMYTSAIKILNQRGIDKFSDFSLPYNSNSESILIEEAQLIKNNGTRIKPEINENQIVWTGLEVNDIIYIKYRIRSYLEGKFAREFYDKFIFDAFIPIELSRYSLIIPNSRKFNYKVVNGDIAPTITELDDYKIYVWEKKNSSTIKEEPYMPPTSDFASSLDISTMNDWNEVAEWYGDVVYSKIANNNDFEVTQVYNELFGEKTDLTANEKAKRIYDYIAKNISYSSVSFRQSGIIPQKASKTINTRLGDCKDISTLFVSLANLCGLKANLVLISTRDNGKNDMILPSLLFNHCIVKYYDEKNREYYLELTDRDMPFRSLPGDLYQALSLTIPSKINKEPASTLTPLIPNNKTTDRQFTKTKIEIDGLDMKIVSTNVKYGSLSSFRRRNYRSLSQENINKQVQESMNQFFTTPIKMNNVSFQALDECLDSISMTTDISVTNNVKKIGSLSAFTIPYTDVIFTASPLALETREYEFEYWNYENADEYETQVEVMLPKGKSFVEIPENTELTFNDITYSISYVKSAPNLLHVVRKAHINRNNISVKDYQLFKSFATKIINLEGEYITFQ